jgi:hypothetical protein
MNKDSANKPYQLSLFYMGGIHGFAMSVNASGNNLEEAYLNFKSAIKYIENDFQKRKEKNYE